MSGRPSSFALICGFVVFNAGLRNVKVDSGERMLS